LFAAYAYHISSLELPNPFLPECSPFPSAPLHFGFLQRATVPVHAHLEPGSLISHRSVVLQIYPIPISYTAVRLARMAVAPRSFPTTLVIRATWNHRSNSDPIAVAVVRYHISQLCVFFGCPFTLVTCGRPVDGGFQSK
jgi:hypothetical protein